jgi:HTH-type transcriptional regulator / antitoxin HigA
MNIQPIHNDDDHRAALAEIERLWDAPEGSEDNEKLEILATLVEKYEEARWPVDNVEFDPVDVLHYAIKEMGHTQAELAKLLNSRSRASEILRRERPLNLDMIRRINEAWKIPAGLLIKPYKVLEAV